MEYSIPFIINPYNACASDISDYRKHQGEEKTKIVLIELEEYTKML